MSRDDTATMSPNTECISNSQQTTSEPTPQPPVANETPEMNPGPEPTKEAFDIPTSQEAYERMVERLATVGLAKWEVDKTIEAKTTAFNRALREHKKKSRNFKRKQKKAPKRVK